MPKTSVNISEIEIGEAVWDALTDAANLVERRILANAGNPAVLRNGSLVDVMDQLNEIVKIIDKIAKRDPAIKFNPVVIECGEAEEIKFVKIREGNVFIDFRWNGEVFSFDRFCNLVQILDENT